MYQDLQKFSVPKKFRQKSSFIVLTWWLVQATIFRLSPQPLYFWRTFLLRLFGAKIGKNVKIRQSARITYPWKIEIGDHSWVGDRAELYSLVDISIGKNCCISQDCYLATASHDYRYEDFRYSTGRITIKDQAWLASGVFIMPNITVGKGVVVAARSVVTKSISDGLMASGTPAKEIGKRNKHL